MDSEAIENLKQAETTEPEKKPKTQIKKPKKAVQQAQAKKAKK